MCSTQRVCHCNGLKAFQKKGKEGKGRQAGHPTAAAAGDYFQMANLPALPRESLNHTLSKVQV